MCSLDNAFNELLDKIRDPDALNPAKSAPVFYFRYPPGMMLTVKKHLPRLISRIRQEASCEVRRVSLADVIWDIVDKSGRWGIWLDLESDADADQINEAVRDVLRQGNMLINRVTEAITSAPEGTIVFLTEAELLHPYLRTRVIEEYLHNKVTVCTIIFYPGERSGQFGLKFLGFYKEDSGYRSTIIGGL
ncbi:MAG TPA: DUF1788 domain-containing protein [Candidatus Hydrogenedentes bacterium]|nr:DUF1788 domain-containing protein [Candidatus Hydrogenedentota bacterium]